MSTAPIVAAAAAPPPDGVNAETLTLSLVGMVVVFVVLALIASIVGLIRRLDDRWQAAERAREAAALDREPTIDATTVVLIAAAVATVVHGRHRIRKIRRLLSPRVQRTPWSAHGRMILQGSHAIERKHNVGER